MEGVWNHQDPSWNWPPSQTEQLGEKGLGQGGGHLAELQSSPVEMGEPSRRTKKEGQKSLQHSTNQPFMVEWSVVSQ